MPAATVFGVQVAGGHEGDGGTVVVGFALEAGVEDVAHAGFGGGLHHVFVLCASD
jgi:hypothetical protein